MNTHDQQQGTTSGEGQPSPSFVDTLSGLGWHAPTADTPTTPADPTDGRSSAITTQLGPDGHVGQIARPYKVKGSIAVPFNKYMMGRILYSVGR